MACVGSDSPCRIAGDDLLYAVQYTDNNDEPINLSGATAKMDLKDSATDAAVIKSMNGGITDPANGMMKFTLTDLETEALLPRAESEKSWVFSVKITYADLTEQTIMTGTLKLEQAATA